MCDPLTATLIGGALTIGSTVAEYSAQEKVRAAREDALAAERIRQKSLDAEAATVTDTSRDRYNDFQGQQDAKAADLGQYFADQTVGEPTAGEVLPTSTSNITVQEEAKQRAKAKNFTDKSGMALAGLRSFGDTLGGISRLQARDDALVRQIGGFKTGSANVLPLELDEAQNAGNSLNVLGKVLGGVGGLTMNYGMGGFGAPSGGITQAAITKSTTNPLILGSLY